MNARIAVFTIVMLLLVGTPAYLYFDSVASGGVKDLGNGLLQVDLKALSTFPFDQENGTIADVPQKWRDLDGKKIVVIGEMWEPYSTDQGVKQFALVYSIAKCCFNGPPQIQHFVQSRTVGNYAAGYYQGPVRVTGTLHVNVVKNDETGKVTSVYQLDVERVEPV
jgi:hypothetical protein